MSRVPFPLLELATPYCSERASGSVVDTIVLHSMFNEHPECGGQLDIDACAKVLEQYEVSAHYLIGRSGEQALTVPSAMRAWHAGKSLHPYDQTENVNERSIGIELLGTYESGFTDAQYESTFLLVEELTAQYSIKFITGHSDIAPTRKSDPWNFDWERLKHYLGNSEKLRDIKIFRIA